ncbi:MAG: hypothetical protein AVDCRST_MAG54-909, partial [uncultured Actinomycetospora sp.]
DHRARDPGDAAGSRRGAARRRVRRAGDRAGRVRGAPAPRTAPPRLQALPRRGHPDAHARRDPRALTAPGPRHVPV